MAPDPKPFRLTPAAARHVVADFTELKLTGAALRVSVYFTSGVVGTRQYKVEPVEEDEKNSNDVRLESPDGPLTVYIDRESFMRLWGYVLDVRPMAGAEGGELGLVFRPPSCGR